MLMCRTGSRGPVSKVVPVWPEAGGGAQTREATMGWRTGDRYEIFRKQMDQTW